MSVLVAALAGACGSSSNSSVFTDAGPDSSMPDGYGPDGSSSGAGDDGPTLFNDAGGGGDVNGTLVIAPANKTLTVTYGQQSPTQTFTATINGGTVGASFAVDLGQIGSIVAATGVFTPSGKVGGTANVTATFGSQTATTKVSVVVQLVDDGNPAGADAGADAGGAGGNGGVGGSGLGGPVDSGTKTLLQGTLTADTGLAWLYPYDKTVWPQGLLAPLLQWSAPRNYDAVYMHLHENGFDYQGYFASNATPFVNVPIPQTAWDTLSYSNQGEPVTATLAFTSNGVAYGPIIEAWTIAQGPLTGTVYYNSYGTNLAQNYCCTKNGAQFGGATLAIKHGATSPVLVAGSNGGSAQCRVCHSVAAQGSVLITQHGDNYEQSSSYALTNAYAETVMAPANGAFGFAAISPDGTYLLSNGSPMPAFSAPGASALYSVATGAVIPSTGLPPGQLAGTPVFSPDGKHVAFNDYSNNDLAVAAMDFASATNTFSNEVTLHTSTTTFPDLFPAFLPTNDAVVFEEETASDGEFGATRSITGTGSGAASRGELWWADLKTQTAAPLAALNGAGYLPTGANSHDQDATLNYEPTINPVASGGYAWVVFTSRRMYGNVATINPFNSDPRYTDISVTPTTKKLWVAAIDLNAKPGTDPSHPAFYLPGQELLAGNSRGYWVVDPCEQNGASCLTGDQCCSGYCEDVDGGFVCGTQPPGCSGLSNKCTQASDCCGYQQGIQCIDGFCSQANAQ
ncbi:MAG TPA: hypothetical protein VGG39_36375 [Polyangiaceae bacterium]